MIDAPGRLIIWSSWAAIVVFAGTAVPAALGVDALGVAALVTSLALFLVSLVVWGWALLVAMARTTQGDDVAVAGLFFLQGSAPPPVRWHLLGSVGVSVVLALATAATDPFGLLVPMLPVGLAGLWGARHGEYPPRAAPAQRRVDRG